MLLPASSGAVRWAMNSRCQSPSGLPNDGEVPHSTSRFTSSGRRAITSCGGGPCLPFDFPLTGTTTMQRFLLLVDRMSTWLGQAFAWLIVALTLLITLEVGKIPSEAEGEIQEIVAYVSGTNTLLAAPNVNRRSLKERGLTDADLTKAEASNQRPMRMSECSWLICSSRITRSRSS